MTRLSLLPFSSPENKYKRVLTNLTDRDCLLFVKGPVTLRRSYKNETLTGNRVDQNT